jgi:toxin-antitoxin system PIN domain toxin
MIDLLDIHVWLALIDQRHVHHGDARLFWDSRPAGPFAFCRQTMLGFLRLSTHPKVLANPLSAEEAWLTCHRLLQMEHITFLQEPPSVDSVFQSLTLAPGLPQRLWTDAYLAAFAIAGGHRLVSFDADFLRFPGLNFLQLSSP